jgi:NAD+ diphosphatase
MHRFCARCGAPTEIAEAGHVRRCPRCGAVHHPRLDPVVIVLVHDAGRALLGRQPTWPAGRYSALAGFVEPGESLEEAVAREVGEESGVAVADIAYHSSQPWPFPASLMLGFHARHVAGEPATLDDELEDVRWFGREEVAAAARGDGPLLLPPPLAIARRLIDTWLA